MSSIQQTYAVLQQMYELMQQLETKTKQVNTEVDSGKNELRAYLSLLTGITNISQRLAGTPDQKRLIRILQSTISILIQLRLQWQLTMAAMGPVGIGLLAIGAIGTALTAGSVAIDVMGEVY